MKGKAEKKITFPSLHYALYGHTYYILDYREDLLLKIGRATKGLRGGG